MFVRLCVDVDQHGQVRGSSAELHDADGLVTYWTDSVSPFDSPTEAFAQLLDDHLRLVGEQQALF